MAKKREIQPQQFSVEPMLEEALEVPSFSVDPAPSFELQPPNVTTTPEPAKRRGRPRKTDSGDGETLVIRLKNGMIDRDGMRQSTLARIDEVLTKNAPPEPIKRSPEAIPLELVKPIISLLGGIEAFFAKKKGIPEPIADDVFYFSAEEVNTLAEPTRKVLAKHLPDGAFRFQEEIELGATLLFVHQQKLARLDAKMREYRANEKRNLEAIRQVSESGPVNTPLSSDIGVDGEA